MIEPVEFKLNNIYQFENSEFKYRPGVTVVTAPNGSGKTNMFERGQFFAWTGLIPGSTSKEDMVRWGQKKGGTELTFRDSRGIEYNLSRAVPGSKACLKWQDGQENYTLTKNTEITEFMEQCLGMPLKLFSSVSFIRQGTFMNVVSDKQSRIEHFNRVTDTLKFQDIRKMFITARSDLPDYPDHRPEIDNLDSQIAELQEKEKQLREEYERAQNARAACEETKKYADRIMSCPVEGEKLDPLIEQRRQEMEALREQIPEEPEAPEQPGVTRQELDGMKKSITQYQEEQKNLESKRQELAGLCEPDPPEIEQDTDFLQMKKGLQSAARMSIQEGECALCGSELSGNFTEETFREEAEKAADAMNRLQEYKEALASYQNRRSTLEKEISDLENSLSRDMPSEEKIEELEQELADYEQNLQEYNRLLNERHQMIQNFRKAESAHERCVLQKQNSVTQEQADEAKQILEKVKELDTALSNAYQAYTDKKSEISSVQTQHDRLVAEQEKRDEIQGKKDMLTRSAEHLKPHNLPMKIMQPFLKKFNPRLKRYLNQFNVDYTCRMTPEFTYEFNRGYGWKSAEKSMSGGQLVNLALSSYLATMDILSPANPLLVMDEPTDSLDDIRKQGLVDALLQLHAAYHNLYIIIISHDKEIKEAADYTVSMDYPEQ